MAQSRAGMGWLVAVIAAMTLMVSTGIWNPFPGIWAWINTGGPLSEPQTSWQQRLLGVPKSVAMLDEYVVIEHRESVEVRSLATGRQLWQADADWAAVAGDTVIHGKLLTKGYQVRDPRTGTVLRRDGKASAVWTYSNAMIEASCLTSKDCELLAREPRSGDELWRVGMPGMGFVLFSDNPNLADAEPITPRSGPVPVPSLFGLRIDNRLHLVDTRLGRVLPVIEPDRETAVHVLGGRVIHSVARDRNGRCILTLSGRDAVNGSEVWRKDGYQLVSLSGAGCAQRGAPTAGADAVVAIRPDGRQALLDAGDGREVLVCEDQEQVLGTDGVHAVVRSADGSKLAGYALGRAKPLWTRTASPKASVVVTRGAVVISDHSPDRIIVLDPVTGKVRTEVRSGAEIVAYNTDGLILGNRRELGYLALAQ